MTPKTRNGRNLWPLLYGIFLTGYAVFTLLDAFVIPHGLVSLEQISNEAPPQAQSSPAVPDEADAEAPREEDEASAAASAVSDAEEPPEEEVIPAEPVLTEDSYTSAAITITLQTIERHETQIYVADIVLTDASCLRTAVAKGTFGRNVMVPTSVIAEENNAILAVNGDFYGFRDRGFVMRQGYLYRDTAQNGTDFEDLVIYDDGRMEIVNESQSDAAELEEAGAVQIFSFGPGLVQNGEITVSEGSEVGMSMQSNPRTAIGQIEPLHYVFMVSDGRTPESAGLSLLQVAEFMSELGCQTAYNLDGGGSSTIWFAGNILNHPTDGWTFVERNVSDIVYIGE